MQAASLPLFFSYQGLILSLFDYTFVEDTTNV